MNTNAFRRRLGVCQITLIILANNILTGVCSTGQDIETVTFQSSCTGRCGTPSEYTKCGCDIKCMAFGDCCLDFESSCGTTFTTLNHTTVQIADNLFNKDIQKFKPLYTSCRSLPMISSLASYPSKLLMVTRCPSWFRVDVRTYCEDDPDANILSLLPVQSESGVIFKNLFCAYCHNVDLEGLTLWKLVKENKTSDLFEIRAPRSPWSVRPDLLCPDNNIFVMSCPDGPRSNLSDQCRLHLDPTLQSSSKYGVVYYKSKYCATCTGINDTMLRTSDLLSVVTNVVFSFGSFSTFKSSCDRPSDHLHTQDSIFQNACRLYETILIEKVVESCRPNECISKFLNDTFHRTDQGSIRQIIQNDRCDSLKARLFLPTELAFHLLNTSINTGHITLQCQASFEIYLTSNGPYIGSCTNKYNATYHNVPYNNYFHAADVHCNRTCEIHTEYPMLETCLPGFQREINCSYSEETLSFLQFTVEDIDPESLIFNYTGAKLSSSQFKFTHDGHIITCTKYLYGTLLAILTNIHIVGSSFSLVGVSAIISLHIVFPKLQTLYGFCLVNLCLSIVITLLLLFVNLLTSVKSDGVAEMTALLSHYSMLAIFSWQMIIAVHVARSFGQNAIANRMSKISTRSTAVKYCLIGWLIPVPFTAVGIILHMGNWTGFHYLRHWMSTGAVTVIIFTTPINILSVISAIFFFIALRNIKKRVDHSTPRNHQSVEHFSVALRLAVTTGLPWLLLNLVIICPHPVIIVVSMVLLSLHGVFLFLAFTSTKTVRNLCFEKISSVYTGLGPGTSTSDTQRRV